MAQRARGKLMREIRDSFTVDAFIGNATDWEKVCMGNLVGIPVIIVPTGLKSIEKPPPSGTRRRTTITTGIYAPPQHDHVALALAMAYQSVKDHHKQRPPVNDLGPNDSIPDPPTVVYPPRSESKEICVYFSKNALLTIMEVGEMAKDAKEFNIPVYRANRKLVASTDGGLHDPSVLVFNPKFTYPSVSSIQRPDREEDIVLLSAIVHSVDLYRYDVALEAVVSYTEDLAYKQAKEADSLLDRGEYLGPLHGIPYGLKDIIAVPHYKTTWGSTTFKNQVLDIEAWVYKRLRSAGAVLIAKLVSGSLAYDDIWFGGRTRNPWNIEEFSTGSSAGPAACTSAGFFLVSLTLTRSIFIKRMYVIYSDIHERPRALALAMAYQSVTDHHKQRPPVNDLGPNDSIPDPPTVVYPPRRWHL
ncbi:hypothetical protein GIB67_013108 [Kingdonia uniflora]|uniref:Amidase domain-containing protein n=1 Tax=Kingdonia uniflora TaxID=39325 RepID=A0A7J7NNI8_9MAGN|nr:hypothetical protein GIB67_013108 [Kingdonia uniflora]